MRLKKDIVRSLGMEIKRVYSMDDIYEDPKIGFPNTGTVWSGSPELGSYELSEKMEYDIHEYAKCTWKNKERHKLSEWKKLTRAALGVAMSKLDDLDDFGLFEKSLNDAIEAMISTKHASNIVFGCTLFPKDLSTSLEIGPAVFETRDVWLNRMSATKTISETTKRRVEKGWIGKKVAKRVSSWDSKTEQNINNVLDDAHTICSVKSEGLGGDFALDKSATSARLGLAGISLCHPKPRNFFRDVHLHYDTEGKALTEKYISVFSHAYGLWAGFSMKRSNYSSNMFGAEWGKYYQSREGFFDVLGGVLNYALHGKNGSQQPNLYNALYHALYWYQKGQTAKEAMPALVNFSFCLDALSKGGKQRGISKLLSARLSIDEDQVVFRYSPHTLKIIVKKIYDGGRSRLTHGVSDRVLQDWTEYRDYSEILARFALIHCFDWVSLHQGADDVLLMSKTGVGS